MTTTTDRLTRPDTEVSELRDLDRSAVLDLAVSSRRSADREEARLLAAAVHWVDLTTTSRWRATARRASRRTPSRSWPPRWICPTQPVWRWSARRSSSASGCRGCGRSCRTAGSRPGRPGRWRRRRRPSHASRWRSSTGTWPSPDPHNRLPAPGPAIHEARLQCDPDQALAVEQNVLAHRGVWFDHRESTATTIMTARVDTLDALDLDGTVSDLASTIGRLGDTSPVDVRRATALGMLAHPQRALDLALDLGGEAEPGPSTAPNGSRGTLYLHVDASDLEDAARSGGSVERLGPATLQLLRDWLRRLSGVTIRPVLDPARTDAVDGHDPPDWMRELVMLRDGHCVFPGCSVDARACDLDHLAPYLPLHDGGPRGQTRPANLACLCRRHHRLKTFAGWHYRRLPDHPDGTTYQWTSPLHRTYRVTPRPH